MFVESWEGKDQGKVLPFSNDEDSIEWKRVDKMVVAFCLNADFDIKQPRLRHLEESWKMLREGKREELRRRASRYKPYSLTVRSFLRDAAPDLIPDAESELRWFVSELCQDLKGRRDLRFEEDCGGASIIRRENIIRWILAVLWKDPPAGTAADIEKTLDAYGIKAPVEKFYQKLVEAESQPAPSSRP